MLAYIFFGDGCFVLSKLVGESAPLPKPRKINASKVSTSKTLKALKRNVTPPLAPPRTLSMKHDNAQDEETYSKSKNNCTSFNKDYISQQEKILKTINDITAENNTTLKSNHEYSNHEIESNFELQNCTELMRISSEEEVHSKFKDKIPIKDEFNQEKRILDIDDNVENYKLLNLNSHLNNEEYTRLDSTELNVSPAKLLSECNVIPQKSENNSLEQDYKMKSKNIDSCDENKDQRDNSCTTLDDNFLNESVTKLDHMTEPRNERLKLLHHRFAYQGLPNAQRKTISSCEIKKNIEAVNLKDATCSIAEINDPDKETCTVISTIPKCEHLDAIREDDTLNNTTKRIVMENDDELREKHQNYRSEESSNVRIAKRTRMIRSQSKSDDFETDTLKKQRRYFTSPPEDIAHALNLNFPARNSISSDTTKKNREQIATGHCTDRAKNADIDKGESYGLITGACCCTTNFYFNPSVDF